MAEIKRPTTFLFDRCPQMDHHNSGLLRGDPKNHSLSGPALGESWELYEYIQSLWATREDGRYGSIVEPMLQYAKTKSIEKQTQVGASTAAPASCVARTNAPVRVSHLAGCGYP